MASGKLEDSLETKLSIASGSEAVFDHVCQPCRDEKIREAFGFCVDCTEWLCGECFRFHKKPKPSRHHVLQTLAEMKDSNSPLKSADTCTEKCARHSGKRLKYYCHIHDFLGCSLCIIQGHGSCKVDHIPDVCESTDIQDEFQQLNVNLGTVAKESRAFIGVVNEQEKIVRTTKADAVQASQSYIKKVKESLDVAGAALEEACVKQADEQTRKLENVSKTCEAIERESLNIKTCLEDLESSGQLCNTFIAVKQYRANVTTLKSKLKDAKHSSSVTTYMFKPTMAVESIITGSDGVGTLVEHHSRHNMYRDYSNVQTRRVSDIIVNSNKTSCSIVGSALLSRDKLLVTDFENKQVIVINTRTNKMISGFKVDGKPWGICKVSDTSVAVTLYDKGKILFLSVSDANKISLSKAIIKVNGQCRGVAVMDDKILVSYIDPAKLEIMDIGGNVLQTISDPKIVHSPCYIAVSPDKTSVYVSNFHNDTVTRMNLDGALIASYKDRKLRGPEQITIDSNGMLFVAALTSKNVHLLTPDCKKVAVVLNEYDRLEKVLAVSYCEHTDKMYIGMGYCNVFKVFKLSF